MNMRIKASTHHSQRRSFLASAGAGFSVPHLVQKRVSAPSSVPQLVQNAFMSTSRKESMRLRTEVRVGNRHGGFDRFIWFS